MRYLKPYTITTKKVIDGLTVIVLAIVSKFADSNPDEDCGFLRAIRIPSTTSFGGEVKPSTSWYGILRHAKNPCGV
jgi:hypothetical protein